MRIIARHTAVSRKIDSKDLLMCSTNEFMLKRLLLWSRFWYYGRMNIIEAKDAIHKVKPEGDELIYYLFTDYEIIRTDQPPHSEQAWHHHETIWETIYIIDGELVVLWRDDGGEKSKLVHAGDVIETGRSSHTFKNETGSVASLIAIKRISTRRD